MGPTLIKITTSFKHRHIQRQDIDTLILLSVNDPEPTFFDFFRTFKNLVFITYRDALTPNAKNAVW